MTNHHPNEELLMAYSASSLPISQALCVSTHLEFCEQCRSHTQKLNSIGGLLLESLAPKAGSSKLKGQVMALLDEPRQTQAARPCKTAEVASNTFLIPRPLRQFMSDGYDSLAWGWTAPDIYTSEICRDDNGAQVSLLRINPGGDVGKHSHTGDEYTVILSGSFSDEDGIYLAGDFLIRDKHQQHRPVASKDCACICLTSVEAPIQFTGFFRRWLNPLICKSYQPQSL